MVPFLYPFARNHLLGMSTFFDGLGIKALGDANESDSYEEDSFLPKTCMTGRTFCGIPLHILRLPPKFVTPAERCAHRHFIASRAAV